MLLAFRVANFRSIRDEQELLLSVPSSVSKSDEMAKAKDVGWDPGISTVAAIYGANASGKSNVLAALGAMQAIVVDSSTVEWYLVDGLQIEPFMLDRKNRDEPSEFEVELQLEGIRHQYGFRMLAGRVVAEWLYAWPRGRRQTWFERDNPNDQDDYYFGKRFGGQNYAIAKLTRPGRLFITVAAEHNHAQATRIVAWFRNRINLVLDRSADAFRSTVRYHTPDAITASSRIVELLKLADLGISGVRLVKKPGDELASRVRQRLGQRSPGEYELQLMHAAEGDEPVALPMQHESHGTQVWFGLAQRVLTALEAGGLLAVDELDSSLHPQLVAELVQIFGDPSINLRQAQLIFNAHDTILIGNLLEEPVLRRDQVWFTEKDQKGATHLYPLSDFKPRKHENLERGYLQGRYGANPIVDRFGLCLVGGDLDG